MAEDKQSPPPFGWKDDGDIEFDHTNPNGAFGNLDQESKTSTETPDQKTERLFKEGLKKLAEETDSLVDSLKIYAKEHTKDIKIGYIGDKYILILHKDGDISFHDRVSLHGDKQVPQELILSWYPKNMEVPGDFLRISIGIEDSLSKDNIEHSYNYQFDEEGKNKKMNLISKPVDIPTYKENNIEMPTEAMTINDIEVIGGALGEIKRYMNENPPQGSSKEKKGNI